MADSAAQLWRGYLVPHVVCNGAQQEVLGVDAFSVIASMPDEQPIRNGAVAQFPRDSVCVQDFTTDANTSVSKSRVDGPQPFPAHVESLPFRAIRCERFGKGEVVGSLTADRCVERRASTASLVMSSAIVAREVATTTTGDRACSFGYHNGSVS